MIDSPPQTKIIATIGPACSSKDVLKDMFKAGVDVCRLNFSHGTREDHLKVIKTINELNRELQSNVAILADLQGPKLRIGEVENNGVLLTEGETIEITNKYPLGLYSFQDLQSPTKCRYFCFYQKQKTIAHFIPGLGS